MLHERDPKSRPFDKGTKKKQQQTCAMECKETETLFIKKQQLRRDLYKLIQRKDTEITRFSVWFPRIVPFVQTFAAVINQEASRDVKFT